MAEPREDKKTYSSNLGGYLDSIHKKVASTIGGAAGVQQENPALGGVLAGLGIDFDPSLITGEGIDPTTGQAIAPPTLEELLLGTAMDVSGRAGLTGSPFRGTMPMWAQAAADRGAMRHPDFDPYLGIVSQPGDERVYLGDTKFKPPKFDEIDDFLDVNAKDPGERAAAREENLRIDRENKVERQLGGDPSKQKAGKKRKSDSTATATQVKNQPYLWDEEEVVDAMKRMRVAGLPVQSFDDLVKVWGSMVDRAASTYGMSAGAKKVTPWDVLDMYKSEAKASGSYTNFQERMNGSVTQIAKSVGEITEGQAFTVLQSQLSQLLGRDPSDDEIKDFTHRMNSLAAKNPSITRTVHRFKNGEEVGQESETDPGFTADDMVRESYEDAQAEEGYGEYQAASTYFNAAISALSALGGG